MAIDRSFTVAGHGTVVTGHGRLGERRRRRRPGMVPRGPARPGPRPAPARPAGRSGRPGGAGGDQPGGRPPRRGPPRAGAGRAGLPGRRPGSSRSRSAPRPTPRGRSATGAATASTWGRPRSRRRSSLLEANELGPGTPGLGQLFLAEPVAAVHGQPFVLREESPPATLGGGRVLQPSARRIRRRDRAAIERLGTAALAPTRSTGSPPRWRSWGLSPWTEPDLCREAGLAARRGRPRRSGRLAELGALVELPLGPRRSVRVLAEFVADLEDRVLRALGRLHAARPRQSAIRRAHLVAATARPGQRGARRRDHRAAQGRGRGRRRRPDRRPARATSRSSARASAGSRTSSPRRSAPAASARPTPPSWPRWPGPRAAVVPELLALLATRSSSSRSARGLYLDFDAEAELRRRVVEPARRTGPG